MSDLKPLEQFMKKPAQKIIAHVDPDLRDLIPGYLKNRHKDIAAIKKALITADFDKIRVLGHSMRGSGGGYGFMSISKIGEAFEEAAKENNPEQIKIHLDKLSDFLQRVTLVYD
jgi:HPt (histidine-containing phosphotransfer) domain-containing protein